MNRAACIKRWTGQKAALESYPGHRGRWPDDDHVEILARLCKGFVCEVGCGTGRCSDAFDPEEYIGVDINEAAIGIARAEQPDHHFYTIEWDEKYPLADTYLFHTCLMHVPDEDLDGVLDRCAGRVVIADWMEPKLHNPRGCVFQRDQEAYRQALRRNGFAMLSFEDYETKYQLGRGADVTLRRRFMTGE